MNRGTSYYGGFFWVSLIAMIVPLFVAWKGFDQVRPTTKPTPQPDASGVDHGLFDYLLRTYVESGLVDYRGIERDHLFKSYLEQLSAADPQQLKTREERLALHCNAYNAFVINGVINHEIHKRGKNVLAWKPKLVVTKIADLEEQLAAEQNEEQPNPALLEQLQVEIDGLNQSPGFFDAKEHLFANQTVSLNTLEHKIIRPTFNEPRIHVALVCAAKSCPSIRAEAYVGARIEQQLEDQAVQFANNETYVRFDADRGAVMLSPILDWYGTDFEAAGGIRTWVAKRVNAPNIKSQLQSADVPVAFNGYDWSLNAVAGGRYAGSTGESSFGSGSVPNE